MKVTERRIVYQDWYETEWTKTGWDTYDWHFDNGETLEDRWEVIEHIRTDKHYNPVIGIAEREVEI